MRNKLKVGGVAVSAAAIAILLLSVLPAGARLPLNETSGTPKVIGYIAVQGIQGEVTLKDYQNQSEIFSLKTGVARTGAKSTFDPFVVEKRIDRATTDLFLKASDGSHVGEVTLALTKAADPPTEYLRYKLNDVGVIAIKHDIGPEDGLTEEIALNYAKVEWEYKGAGGSKGCFNVAQNAKC